MEKFICDNCGYKFDKDTSAEKLICPICKGNCITEKAHKEREEIMKLIAEDKEQEAREAEEFKKEEQERKGELNNIVAENIINDFKITINKIGNDRTWETIECLYPLETRLAYRKYFFCAGGLVPEGEPLNI